MRYSIAIIFCVVLFKTSIGQTRDYIYGQCGFALENAKYPGGKFLVGFQVHKTNAERGFGAGLGGEYLSYSQKALNGYAIPVFLDFRHYFNVKNKALFINLNFGPYNYSVNSTSTLNLGNGEGINTTVRSKKNTPFGGLNFNFIIPFLKSKPYTGVYISAGYRIIKFETKITTEEKRRLQNGGGISSTIKSSESNSVSSFFHTSVGLSF